MGKYDKYTNTYDRDGNLIRKVGPRGKIEDYTVEELEELVDKLANDKDENGKVKNPVGLNNANKILFQYYTSKKGAHRLKELLQKLQEESKARKTTKEQAVEAINEVKEILPEE